MEKPANGYAFALEEFVALFEKPVEWIWDTMLPTEALVVLSAAVKNGKSTLTYGLLAAMVKGEPFLGFATRPTPTLIIIPEEGCREVANRLASFGLRSSPTRVEIRRMREPTVSDYAALIAYIEKHKFGLVIIDTLAAFIRMYDENDNAEMVRVMQPLLDLAHDHKVTVLAIHHTGKSSGNSRDVAKASRGASALSAVVDLGWVLTKIGGKRTRRRWLETISRIPEAADGLEYAYDKFTHSFTHGQDMPALEEGSPSTMAEDIESLLLLGSGPLSGAEIALKLGKTVKRIQQELVPLPEWCVKTGEGVRGKPFRYDHKDRGKEPAIDGGDSASEEVQVVR